MTDFTTMTIAEIKTYAEKNNIDVSGVRTKAEIIGKIVGFQASVTTEQEKSDNIIESKSIRTEPRVPVSSTVTNNNNVVSSRPAEKTFQKIIKEEKMIQDKIALYSNKNIHWIGLGHISKGYNIVTKEEAEKWLTRTGIRQATPEEVATHYGL
jgi:hypothetical protein